jgi:type IV secretory pathway TraG/TraD family ATPase VirD4
LFCETHKQKKQLKSAIIIDELPIIHCRGLDNLIATARSNKVAVCLGFQDFSQLKRDYGDKEAAVVMNRRKLNTITTKSKPM